MKRMKLDKNYNFSEVKDMYSDDLIEAIDLISSAQSKNIITSQEANILYKVAIKREIKKETKKIIPSSQNSSEIHSIFMNMKSNHIRHA